MNPNAQKAWDAIEQWKQDDCRYKEQGAEAPVLPARNISRQESSLPTSSVQVLRCYERPTWKSLSPYEAHNHAHNRYQEAFRKFAEKQQSTVDRLTVEEIKQEIRELDSLLRSEDVEADTWSPELNDFAYRRINELLDMLDADE